VPPNFAPTAFGVDSRDDVEDVVDYVSLIFTIYHLVAIFLVPVAIGGTFLLTL
jgi:hypothetical protein